MNAHVFMCMSHFSVMIMMFIGTTLFVLAVLAASDVEGVLLSDSPAGQRVTVVRGKNQLTSFINGQGNLLTSLSTDTISWTKWYRGLDTRGGCTCY